MKKFQNLLGKKFGKWKVLEYSGFYYDKFNHKRHNWLCECQCEYKTRQIVNHLSLVNNNSNSCRKCVNKKYNTYDLSGEYGIGYTSKGEEFYFDLEDYDKIKNYCWHKHQDGYLRTKISKYKCYILQHRFILECDNNLNEVDHKNRLRYDNRKNNLILVSHNENMKNYGIYKNNISGVIGVYYAKSEQAWKAYIQFNNERFNLGTFVNIEDAIISRLTKEKELYNSINKKPPQIHLYKLYNIC